MILNIEGYDVIIDDEDFEKVKSIKWRRLNQKPPVYFCKGKKKDGKYCLLLLHRIIANAPSGLEVDHINGNTLDNRKKNLRLCTHQENSMNMGVSKRNKSGFKGCSFHKESGKWQARICRKGVSVYLGIFDTPEEAYQSYCEASKQYHKEFGRIA